MRHLIAILLLVLVASAQTPPPQLPADDGIRIREFYRLAAQVQDKIWPNWSTVPAPLILVTKETEFLTHHGSPPPEFKKIADDFYVRPRQHPLGLQATFPAFGPPAVIVIGEPRNTQSKTSTPWLVTVMHEHFHQLQYGQPGYYQAVEALGLARGEKSGMWMLNYPFPYDKPEVAQEFARLRNLLLAAVSEADRKKFTALARQYTAERKKFFALVSADDHKYFSFQLWQEGIARYTQVKAAEAAAEYQPTAEFAALADYEPFSAYAARARKETLDELKQADLAKMKREAVYSFGGAEGLLLDRINPKWKEEYFKELLSTDGLFDSVH